MLIPAAGAGARMKREESKVLIRLGGRPLIEHTVHGLLGHPAVERIVVVARQSDFSELERIFANRAEGGRIAPWVEGGPERQDSVWQGLGALGEAPPDWVLIHDAARPFFSQSLLDRVLAALEHHGAVVPRLPIFDTVRRVNGGGSEVLERASLFRCQTPQGFHWKVLAEAHREANAKGLRGTDDAQLVEAAGHPVRFVAGEERNLKVTAPDELAFGEWLLQNPDLGLGGGPEA